MTPLQGLTTALAAIMLFLYALKGFSQELQLVGGEKLKVWLGKMTASRWRGFLIGVVATAAVQSSSAISALAVSLVDTSVISFKSSLGILLGANVGTTSTAWLVSFKLTGVGPFFIVLGTLLSALPWRIKVFGKSIFYFGLIFLGLDLISRELKPLASNETFKEWLALAQTPWKGVLAGILFTAVTQSSSVTTGLGILLVQQSILPPETAIPIVIGANVGSTSTALIASMGMKSAARSTAISNFLFNLVGMLLFLPFLSSFSALIVSKFGDPGLCVAWAHLIFNLTLAFLFLFTLNWVGPLLERWLSVR